MIDKYLFIIAMNHAGSTVARQVFGQHPNVIDMPVAEEGHMFMGDDGPPIPNKVGCAGLWSQRPDLYSDPNQYDWSKIEESWRKVWSRNVKYNYVSNRVLLEKTPSDIMRLDLIKDYFAEQSRFFIIIRNTF